MNRAILFWFWLFIFLAPTSSAEIIGRDDLGRKIILPKPPQRIVVISAIPIDTIFEIGAGDRIVGVPDGISRSYLETCKRYPSLLTKEKVGRFSNPHIEKIVSLMPDLIICYDSLDTPGKYTAPFEKLKIPYAVVNTPKNISAGLSQIKRLGVLLGKEEEAKKLAKKIKEEIDKLVIKIQSKTKTKKKPLVYYWFGMGIVSCGNKSVVNELIKLAGGTNLAEKFNRQYVDLSFEYVMSKDPDVIIISYWGDDQVSKMKIKEIIEKPGFSQVKAVKNNRIYTINGHFLHTPVLFPEAIRKLAEFIHQESFR